MRLILDLSLGERGPATDTPVHRFFPFVYHPLLDERTKSSHDARLVPEVHRKIGRFPLSEDSQTLEVLTHQADILRRVLSALTTKARDTKLALLLPEVTVDLELDWQTVTVPPRDIRRVESFHRTGLDDEVFEDLIECGSDVNPPVGIRRTVVQHKTWGTGPTLPDSLVQTDRLPTFDRLGFRRGEAGFHRKTGPR